MKVKGIISNQVLNGEMLKKIMQFIGFNKSRKACVIFFFSTLGGFKIDTTILFFQAGTARPERKPHNQATLAAPHVGII